MKCGKIKGAVLNHLLAFEVVLIVAAYLSYDMAVVRYFIAYNLGMITFWSFRRYDLRIGCLEKLGELGFTFFLGAGIPMLVLGKFLDLSAMNVCLEVVVKFLLALALSRVVTRYIETPLLAKGKQLEKKIR